MLRDRLRISGQIEDMTHTSDNSVKSAELRESNGDRERGFPAGFDHQKANFAIQCDYACVALRRHDLDALDRANGQVADRPLPIEWGAVRQFQSNSVHVSGDFTGQSAKRAWGAVKQGLKDLVKSPNAAESRCQRHLGHRQSGFME